MFFNPKKIGKMKMAELEDAIKVYEEQIADVKVVELANNDERKVFLEALVNEHGVPVRVTEDNVATLGGKVDDIVFIPAPSEEDEAREVIMTQLAELVADMSEEKKADYLEEVNKLELIDLTELVNKLVADKKEAAEASTDDEEEENAATGNSEASDEVSEEDEDEADLAHAAIQTAIENGELRFENRVITGYRPKVLAGSIHFELFGSDGATYLASKAELQAALGLTDEV